MLDFDLINRNVDSVRASLKNKQGVGVKILQKRTRSILDGCDLRRGTIWRDVFPDLV